MPLHPGSRAGRVVALELAAWESAVQVGGRGVDGSLVVLDRTTSERMVVYTPRFQAQFSGGHRASCWYIRPAAHVGAAPVSRAFATARAAIQALAENRWRLVQPAAGKTASRPLRVIWTKI